MDNLANTQASSAQVINDPVDFLSAMAAQGFTAPQAATIQSVTLNMANAVAPGGGFTVSIYSDSSGIPGSSLLTLTGSSNPSSAGNYIYTGALALSAGTTYWIVASVSGATSAFYNWNTTVDSSNTGSAALTMAEGNSFGSGWLSGPGDFMKVQVTAVPEPVAWGSITSLALAGFAFFFRRRNAL